MELLSGFVERVTFHNNTTGFCVFKLKINGKKDPITVTTTVASLMAGEQVQAQGEWQTVTPYGVQFKAISLQASVPENKEGLEKYLASGSIKGIGPVYAKKLIQTFGTSIIQVIENFPERLRKVEGIGQYRCNMIIQSWHEQKTIRDIMVFLHEAGVNTGRSLHIFRVLGPNALELIQKNPYCLTLQVRGISFKVADTIARVLNINPLSVIRVSAGLHHILKQALDQGHCALPVAELLEKTQILLDLPMDLIEEALNLELASNQFIKDSITQYLPHQDPHQIEVIFLKWVFLLEKNTANLLKKRLEVRPLWVIPTTSTISDLEQTLGIHLSISQKEALPFILNHTITVITGGPGVGKTTLLKSLILLLTKQHLKIALAAPTGRAAKRLAESSGMPAKTLHRLLEIGTHSAFTKTEEFVLDCDILIIDEMSMVDISLFYKVLQSLAPSAALIMVGDIDQLPSIGPGKVLEDLIQSDRIPTVRLKEIFRQVADSQIILNAHRLRNGVMPQDILPNTTSDFYFIHSADTTHTIEKVVDLITKRIPERFSVNPVTDIQLLCPMTKSNGGTYQFNTLLRPLLNPNNTTGIKHHAWEYKPGDKVMQIENNYDKDVYNGDIGYIHALDLENSIVFVQFEDRIVEYERYDLDHLIPAYSITVHKAQGSEYPVVIIPLLKEHQYFLDRRLIYTAVTRSKILAILIGNRAVLKYVLTIKTEKSRWTKLGDWLKD